MMSGRISNNQIDPGSFRDPSGFVFTHGEDIYRQVNKVYGPTYDLLRSSGLYDQLAAKELLIPHQEVSPDWEVDAQAYKIIKPEKVPFISYPYEWSFSQLKDAALVTLEIQTISMEHGLSLKDASAYNIQFLKGRPVFIDTLSFESYDEDKPWVAYRQFCQHFLAPLALMSLTDVRLGQLLRSNIDGVPLDLAASLLPFRSRLTFSLLTHIILHAKSQAHFSPSDVKSTKRKMSRQGLLGLLDNLQSAVNRLKWKEAETVWGDYYQNTNYSDSAFEYKKELVGRFLKKANASKVWDMGANTGTFSRVAASFGIPVIAFDFDPAAVEFNYREVKKNKETLILPLLLDLTNPSPGLGWENRERSSVFDRASIDTVMALALVHHLAISNNLPLPKIALFFKRICHKLIIEFVPKSDSQTKRLLSSREDIFSDYNIEGFKNAFEPLFEFVSEEKIPGSERTLYLLTRR